MTILGISSALSMSFRKVRSIVLHQALQFQKISSTSKPETAYLSGLRGLTALAIIWCDLGRATKREWTWGGGFAIPLSCVISGYVLSILPIQHIQNRNPAELLSIITSRTFRRLIRLYIPAVAATLLAATFAQLGLYDFSPGFRKPLIKTFDSWSQRIDHVYEENCKFLYMLDWRRLSPTYVRSLWTLRTMLRGHMILFLVIVGLSRVKRVIRCFFVALFMLSAYHDSHIELMSMLGGLIVADLHFTYKKSNILDGLRRRLPFHLRWEECFRLLAIVMLIASSITLTLPTCSKTYFSICSLVPEERADLAHPMAAMLLVFIVGGLSGKKQYRQVLTHPSLLFLSTLSYSIYLVHDIVTEVIGYRIGRRFLYPPGVDFRQDSIIIVIFCFLIIGAITICTATAFCRLVDMPTVRFTKELESCCSMPPPAPVPELPTNCQTLDKSDKDPTITVAITRPSIPYSSKSEQSRSVLLRIAWFLVPSIVQEYIDPKESMSYSTEWLDGLRGIAALFVFWHHLMNPFYSSHAIGFGHDAQSMQLIRLPIIRIMYTGHGMFGIFFLISGYVLSMKSIARIRTGTSYTALLASLSSSIFRRAPRLLLPVMASTFINFVLARLGAFEFTKSFAEDKILLPGHHERHVQIKGSFSEQLGNWITNIEGMTSVFSRFKPHNPYDPHTWTINVEFRCSMLVFLYVLCFAKTKTWIRISFGFALSYHLLQVNRWLENMFLLGILIAEINQAQGLYGNPKSDTNKIEGPFKRALGYTSFFVAMLISSCPDYEPWNTPGYRTLVAMVEIQGFWGQCGSVLVVLSVSNSYAVQSLFANRFIRYLANLSFSLYLMHYMTIHIFGYAIIPRLILWFGKDSAWGYEFGFGLGFLLVTIITFVLSDIFWRAVDVPCTKFVRMAEMWCLNDHI